MKKTSVENINTGDKNLGHYFDQARSMKPVAEAEEIATLIMNAGAHSTPAPKHIQYLKLKIIMTTSIITICAFVTGLLYHNDIKNTNTNATTALKNDAKQETAVKTLTTVPGKNDINNPGNIAEKYAGTQSLMALLSAQSPMDNIMSKDFMGEVKVPGALKTEETQLSPIILAQKINPPRAYPVNRLSSIKPVAIDKANLAKLGIKPGKNGLEYFVKVDDIGAITYTNSTQGCGLFIQSDRRENHMHSKEIKEIVIHDGDGAAPKENNLKKPHQKLDFYAALITDLDGKQYANIDSLFNRRNQNGDKDTSKVIELIPVLVHQSEFDGFNEKKDLVFWFTSSSALERILKETNHADIQAVPVYRAWGITDEEMHKNDVIDPAALQSIKPLELTNDQMEKLGFELSATKIAYKCTVTDKGKIDFLKSKTQAMFRVQAPLKEPEKGQDYYPVFITDKDGVRELKYSLDNPKGENAATKENFLATIRTLVPVLVKQKWHDDRRGGDLIFWFNVTPDFLAALPNDVSKEMGKEYQQLIKKPSTAPDTATQVNCKYFDVCQMPLERQLKVNIYPNPAQLLLNVDFELAPNTTATLSMTDLSGKVVKTIDQTFSGTGAQHAEIATASLPAGIYLVLLKLNNGTVLNNKVILSGKD